MRVTILGCGPSGGVPSIGGDQDTGYWGACNPKNPKNIRTRCSILVEDQNTKILVDTSPDMRQQFLRHSLCDIDAVLFTHAHADHTHGIDDLRQVVRRKNGPVDIYGDQETLSSIERRFHYLFTPTRPDVLGSKPWVVPHIVQPQFSVCSVKIQSFEQDHGFSTTSLGYRFGDFAYSTDAVALDDKAFDCLKGVKIWVVDCLRLDPHPTHSWLQQTLEWVNRVKPERAYLTHLGQELDYDHLQTLLPENVQPAYDGLLIDV